jgi:hypothetical protein
MFDRSNRGDEQDLAAALAKRFAPAHGTQSSTHAGYRSHRAAAKLKRCNVGEVAEWLKAAVC